LLLTRSPGTITVGEVLSALNSESLEIPFTGKRVLTDNIGVFRGLFEEAMKGDGWTKTIESLGAQLDPCDS